MSLKRFKNFTGVFNMTFVLKRKWLLATLVLYYISNWFILVSYRSSCFTQDTQINIVTSYLIREICSQFYII